MKPDTELEALMLRYQGGDLLAATALVKDLSPSLYKLFAVHTMSRQHTDDLLQETWLRIHHVRHTYRPGERFLPWLYAIARHVRVDHYRRLRRVAHREQQLDDVPEPGAKSAPPGPDGQSCAMLNCRMLPSVFVTGAPAPPVKELPASPGRIEM